MGIIITSMHAIQQYHSGETAYQLFVPDRYCKLKVVSCYTEIKQSRILKATNFYQKNELCFWHTVKSALCNTSF